MSLPYRWSDGPENRWSSPKTTEPGDPETQIRYSPPEMIDSLHSLPVNNRWSKGQRPKIFKGSTWGLPSSVRHEKLRERRRQRDGSIGTTARFRNGQKKTKNARKDAISIKMKEVDDQRKKAQPQYIKTAGSTFKNPKDQTDKKAWEIIEEAGLKNFQLQGICFSSKHSNFIVNNQTKSANLIEDFGEYVRSDVKKKLGISLNWEIKIFGER